MPTFELLDASDPHEINELAIDLAGEAARTIIECECTASFSGPTRWMDTTSADASTSEEVAKALRFLHLVDGETATYRMVRSIALPHLVKFVDRE